MSTVCFLGIGASLLNRLQLYRAQQLHGVKLESVSNGFIIFVPIPLESLFIPTLVESRREENKVIVTVYKQLSTPWQGPYRTLISTASVKESKPRFDSERALSGFIARVYHFDLKDAEFYLRTADGDIQLPSPPPTY